MHEINFTPLGSLFAFIFALSMSSMLWWMMHLPPYIPAAAAKARRAVGAIKRILVPTIGIPYSERGVELACRLGSEQKAEIVLTYVIEVPRTLPLDAPLPLVETKANEALSRAQSIVTLRGLEPTIRIERARVAGEQIVNLAKELDVDLIVMGIKSALQFTHGVLGSTTELILRRGPCEVIIDRMAEE